MVLAELQAAAVSPSVDLDDCVRLVHTCIPALDGTPRALVIETLLALHDAATRDNAGQSAPSPHTAALNSLLADECANDAVDLDDPDAYLSLDELLRTFGDGMRAPLVTAFTRHLRTLSRWEDDLVAMSLTSAGQFLTRLFLLEHPNLSAYYSDKDYVSVYDSGEDDSVDYSLHGPLWPFKRALPSSADGASVPLRWREAASDICVVLCGELSVSRLDEIAETGSGFDVAELTMTALLLFALRSAQPSSDAAAAARDGDAMSEAASRLCRALKQVLDRRCSTVLADQRERGFCVERIIEPLLPLLDLLTRPHSSLHGDSADNTLPLLAAVLPIAQQLLLWLQAQVAALSATCWRYPQDVSAKFVEPPRPTSNRVALSDELDESSSDDGSFCCEHCQRLHLFLDSATERSTDLPLSDERRRHIEERIQSLLTPHLDRGLLSTADGPYTLRVSKQPSLAAVWSDRRKTLQALADRLSASIASIHARQDESARAVSASTSSSDTRPDFSKASAAPKPPAAARRTRKQCEQAGSGAAAGSKRRRDQAEVEERDAGRGKQKRRLTRRTTASTPG